MYFVIRTRKIYPIYFGKIQVTNNYVNIGTSGVMVYALNETIQVKYSILIIIRMTVYNKVSYTRKNLFNGKANNF